MSDALVALTWVGRGDFTAGEWDAALAQVLERRKRSKSEYLLGIPLLTSYFEAGLDEFGESRTSFEEDRQ